MKFRFRSITGVILCGFALIMHGCVSIKGFERGYLSREEMQLSDPAISEFEISIETFREGASGGNSGQSGGGCGCY